MDRVEIDRAKFGIEPSDSVEVANEKRLDYFEDCIAKAAANITQLNKMPKISRVKEDLEFYTFIYHSNVWNKVRLKAGHDFTLPEGECRCHKCRYVI